MAIVAAKSIQSCPTLCDHIDGSPPGSPVPGILQARTLEWVAISFSNAWKWKVKVRSLSRVWFLETTWTAAHQAPPSMGFARQEHWSGVPLPSPIMAIVKLKNTSVTDTISQGELQLDQVQKNSLLNIHLGWKECSDSYTEWFSSNDPMMATVVFLLKYWVNKCLKSVCIEECSQNWENNNEKTCLWRKPWDTIVF